MRESIMANTVNSVPDELMLDIRALVESEGECHTFVTIGAALEFVTKCVLSGVGCEVMPLDPDTEMHNAYMRALPIGALKQYL